MVQKNPDIIDINMGCPPSHTSPAGADAHR
jgi:tRNA-dihydrouridine synthase